MLCKDGGLTKNLIYIYNGMETIQFKETSINYIVTLSWYFALFQIKAYSVFMC